MGGHDGALPGSGPPHATCRPGEDVDGVVVAICPPSLVRMIPELQVDPLDRHRDCGAYDLTLYEGSGRVPGQTRIVAAVDVVHRRSALQADIECAEIAVEPSGDEEELAGERCLLEHRLRERLVGRGEEVETR